MERGGGAAKIRGVLAALLVFIGTTVHAQAWSVQAGGVTYAEVVADAPEAAGAALVALKDRGYHYARVDSLREPVVYVTPGPLVVFGRVEVLSDSLPADRYRGVLSVREGEPALSAHLAEDLQALTDIARAEGFADPRVVLSLRPPSGDSLDVGFQIHEGERLPLGRVVLRGARRATDAFALRASGLASGEPVIGFDPGRVRQALLDSGAFVAVGIPELVRDPDGALVVEVEVEEGPPGMVDAVLGYLPPTAGRSGELVGTARVDLASPFGGGRTMALALDRSPGLASRLAFAASDPFVFGLPLRVGIGFEGEGRDSLYSRQRGAAEVGIRLAPGLSLAVTAARESVQPGRSGARVGNEGVPRVRRSSAWFGGLTLRFTSLDSRRAPSRGLLLVTAVEQGVRARDALDALSAPTRLSQQRLDVAIRGFVPVRSGIVGVLGGDLRALLTARGETSVATRYDEGELFRFGGAASLRGYDEDTFLGNVVGRALAEVRAGLGGETFAFAFSDFGLVRRPEVADLGAEARVLPGYGLGVQLQAGQGLVAVTYALNPDLPLSRGKVHLRLQLGL